MTAERKITSRSRPELRIRDRKRVVDTMTAMVMAYASISPTYSVPYHVVAREHENVFRGVAQIDRLHNYAWTNVDPKSVRRVAEELIPELFDAFMHRRLQPPKPLAIFVICDRASAGEIARSVDVEISAYTTRVHKNSGENVTLIVPPEDVVERIHRERQLLGI